MTDWLKHLIRSKARAAGRQYERTRRAFREGSQDAQFGLPRDEDGHVRIVCRRFAEQRAVDLDDRGRPHCFDPDHSDCQGCVEDIRDGRIETW